MTKKRILLTVTTYPLPSKSYDELICTAGILEDGTWIRIYPVPFKILTGLRINGKMQSYKYSWIELDLKERTDDFRPESHSPIDYTFSDITILKNIGTKNNWAERKMHCLKNVYTSLNELIDHSKDPSNKSLATFKPTEILDFIVEETERDWKPKWKEQIKQFQLDFDNPGDNATPRTQIKKVPYKFYYKFKDSDGIVRRLMIEDWEIGALYWNCLKRSNGNEKIAIEKIKAKYKEKFLKEHELFFFLGTTREWHMRRAKNPFVIIGVFYPKVETQMSLF